MTQWSSDFRHAVRALRVRPLATASLVVILAVGNGLTATLFALADPFLLRPLPYADPDRLVTIRVSRVGRSASARVPTIDDWSRRTDLFSRVTGFGEQERIRLIESGVAYQVRVMPVAADFFEVLGAKFSPPDLWTPPPDGAERVLLVEPRGAAAVFSGVEWRDRLISTGADGAVRVAGAVPADFVFPLPRVTSHPDALTPARLGDTIAASGGVLKTVTTIARLHPHVDLQVVRAALSVQAGPSFAVVVNPLSDGMKAGMRGLALGALAASLLIAFACAANAANFVLTRTLFRRYEFDTRRALGAGPWDIARLLVFELVLQLSASVGAAIGLASILLHVLRAWMPAEFLLLGEPAITGRPIAAAVLLAIAMLGLLLLSALLGARPRGLAVATRRDPKGVPVLRIVMVSGQTATAMALVVGGSMLVKSQSNLWSQEIGFDWRAQIVTVSFPPQVPPARVREEIYGTVDALHGLTAAPVGALVGPLLDNFMTIGGPPLNFAGRRLLTMPRLVTTGYFDAAGIGLLAGRVFSITDRPAETLVVNDAFVRQHFPGRDPRSVVGERFERSGAGGEIIGVVQNVYDRALDRPPGASTFQLIEAPDSRMPVSFVIGAGVHEAQAGRIREVIQRMNPGVVVNRIGPLDDMLAVTVRDRTFATLIMAIFAVAGVIVAAMGIFAVVSFLSIRRTRELAIRLAVGGSPAALCRLVVQEAVVSATAGLATGIMFAVWAAGFARHLLYNVEPSDPLILLSAVVGMQAIVIAASWLPAARVVRLSPAETLRAE
jgi:predicted permease